MRDSLFRTARRGIKRITKKKIDNLTKNENIIPICKSTSPEENRTSTSIQQQTFKRIASIAKTTAD
jgi:hypothetical protein